MGYQTSKKTSQSAHTEATLLRKKGDATNAKVLSGLGGKRVFGSKSPTGGYSGGTVKR